MSSAILYLAIVAIWALVLIPRWLHPGRAASRPPEHTSAPGDGSAGDGPAEGEDPAGNAAPAVAGAEQAGPTATAQRVRVLRARRRMLGMLVVIVAGAAAMAFLHLAASWVVIPPAVMLAGFLLLLREAARTDAERAQAAQTRAAQAYATPGRAVQAPVRATGGSPAATGTGNVEEADAPATSAAAPEPSPDAEVIDISARVTDQFYDQYSDAAERAVGD